MAGAGPSQAPRSPETGKTRAPAERLQLAVRRVSTSPPPDSGAWAARAVWDGADGSRTSSIASRWGRRRLPIAYPEKGTRRREPTPFWVGWRRIRRAALACEARAMRVSERDAGARRTWREAVRASELRGVAKGRVKRPRDVETMHARGVRRRQGFRSPGRDRHPPRALRRGGRTLPSRNQRHTPARRRHLRATEGTPRSPAPRRPQVHAPHPPKSVERCGTR
jgi:hypothetical protein